MQTTSFSFFMSCTKVFSRICRFTNRAVNHAHQHPHHSRPKQTTKGGEKRDGVLPLPTICTQAATATPTAAAVAMWAQAAAGGQAPCMLAPQGPQRCPWYPIHSQMHYGHRTVPAVTKTPQGTPFHWSIALSHHTFLGDGLYLPGSLSNAAWGFSCRGKDFGGEGQKGSVLWNLL